MRSTRIARGFALALILLVPACGVGGGGTLTPTTAPAIPAGLSAVNGNGSITLTWTPSPAATSYQVSRSPDSGGPYAVVTGGGTVPAASFTDATVTNDVTYHYVVQASNTFGQSPPSAEIAATAGFRAEIAAACGNHSLAQLGDGTVWAWGNGFDGELGNGVKQTVSNHAVRVQNLSNVRALDGGDSYSLALLPDGTVYAWGRNDQGQLANPSIVGSSAIPVRIPGLTGVKAIAAGKAHVLAVKEDGTVFAWGGNGLNQLGLPILAPFIDVPTMVPGLPPIRGVSAGYGFSLAVGEDGLVWSWGDNFSGQLGYGYTSSTPSDGPGQVSNLTNVKTVAAGGGHSVALRQDGTLWTWGGNLSGQLGIGSTAANSPLPVPIPSLTGIIDVKAHDITLALRIDRTVWSWGSGWDGALGDGTSGAGMMRNTPYQIQQASGAETISAKRHCLIRQADDSVWGWGANFSGQVGGGTGGIIDSPVQTWNLTSVTAFAAGEHYSLAARTDGSLWVWGLNNDGQLGLGAMVHPNVPTKHATLVNVADIAAGPTHSLLVLTDGTVRSAGRNHLGQLGNNSTNPSNVFVTTTGLTGVSKAATGWGHSLALKTDGTVWHWGGTMSGLLQTAVQVTGLTGIVAIGAGNQLNVALKNDGTVWTWGTNGAGQLGVEAPLGSALPLQIPALSGITAIGVGDGHTLAVKNDGTVWTWGANGSGQLGDGSTEPFRQAPAPVPGITTAVAAGAGIWHSVVLLSDGTVTAWGGNFQGQVGNGIVSNDPVPAPQPVAGITTGAALRAGERHTLVRLANGTLMGWGSNNAGELGIGSSNSAPSPIRIDR